MWNKLHGDTGEKKMKIKGSVVLMKKNVLDFNDLHASMLDRVHEFFGKGVSLQLISSVNGDHGAGTEAVKGVQVQIKESTAGFLIENCVSEIVESLSS